MCCTVSTILLYKQVIVKLLVRLLSLDLTAANGENTKTLKNKNLFTQCCQTPFQLANPNQLQLVGVGVGFVFPLEEGRKKKTKK